MPAASPANGPRVASRAAVATVRLARPRRVQSLAILVGTMSLTLLAAIAIALLHDYADQRRQAQILLGKFDGLSYRLSRLQEEAEVDGAMTPKARATMLETRRQMTQALDALARLNGADERPQRIRAAALRYDADVDELLRLALAGRADDVRAWKAEREDPDWQTLRALSAEASAAYAADSERAGRLVAIGSVATPMLTALGLCGLFRLFARSAREVAQRQRLVEALAASERRLQHLVGRLVVAQEEERRRVAYDVHDGLAQIAASAYQHLQAYRYVHPPSSSVAQQDLDQALALAHQTVREARRVIADLRPTALDDFGLATAVRLRVEQLRAEGWGLTFREALGPERLPPTIETALYRVVQEALNNVRKHAHTTRVALALEHDGHGVRLRVRDWGRGFEPCAVRTGMRADERVGLHGMRERVALLGGHFVITSEPGAGTQVLAWVPLPRGEEDAHALVSHAHRPA